MKKYTKSTNKFTEEEYNAKRQAINVLSEAGLSVRQIAENLKIGKSTANRMKKQTWEEHLEFLANETEKRQDKPVQRVQTQPTDSVIMLANRLSNIEAKIDLMLEKVNKKGRLF